MSENKNDMSFADKIARVNKHNMQAVADAHNNLLKRVEVLEQENKEQWDFIIALSDDVARLLNKNEQSEESEQKTEFVQIGGQKLRISPYKAESETVSWKDFEDFLDDNAEDFESIGERLDAIEDRLKALESLDLWNKCDGVMAQVHALRGRTKMHEDRLNAIEEKIEGYVFE